MEVGPVGVAVGVGVGVEVGAEEEVGVGVGVGVGVEVGAEEEVGVGVGVEVGVGVGVEVGVGVGRQHPKLLLPGCSRRHKGGRLEGIRSRVSSFAIVELFRQNSIIFGAGISDATWYTLLRGSS